jgi:hypothetical protein
MLLEYFSVVLRHIHKIGTILAASLAVMVFNAWAMAW